jgi:hypothetical protein
MANNTKIRNVMVQITRNPNLHNQSNWFANQSCGTTKCVGGWAIHEEGIPYCYRPGEGGWILEGDESSIEKTARNILELTEQEGIYLFFSSNLDGVWTVVEEITNRVVTRVEVEAWMAANPEPERV